MGGKRDNVRGKKEKSSGAREKGERRDSWGSLETKEETYLSIHVFHWDLHPSAEDWNHLQSQHKEVTLYISTVRME